MTWRGTSISPTRTHHIRNGLPLYTERFDEVLKFRDPGLAAVQSGGKAWHIRSNGAAAYARRFRRVFGFYEGLAAAVASDGWRHIRPSGSDLYSQRFAWGGNFQDGRCPVREFGGAYLHLTREGVPAYGARWRYVGDFRDGIAVVQSDGGCCTHISRDGEPIHGVWFLDLDVFHKGFARARDENGWMHIDTAGRPLYQGRFAAAEPFYNGQARVERLDGGLEVIDEAGDSVVELRPAMKSEFAALSDDLTGFWRTQAICAAVELGVFEALPATAAELARACGLEEGRAERLLRALAELRLATDEGGWWRTTGRGALLTGSHPWTLADAAVEYGRWFPKMWEALPKALGGGSAWKSPDVFADVAADAARITRHHRMLASYARHDYAGVPSALRLRGDERVLDAGGGFGVLARLLAKAHPGLRVTVLDRPEVVERAACLQRNHRVAFEAVDLFGPWGVEGDTVVLARVLHDWDEAPALRLLHQARRALPQGGRLFVIEMVLSEDGSMGGLCDLHLMVATGGGERTASEYASLFERTGFAFEEIRQMAALPSVVVGMAR